MRQILGLMAFTVVAARTVELSYSTTHPINVLAPSVVALLTACTMCVVYLLRDAD
ncbi:MAG: hypothetical protein ACLF0G_02450 [Candidatus Brocadiia bacterium]